MQELNDLERAKRRCRTFIDGKPIYEVLPSMYRDMSSCEISSKTGISSSVITFWARRLSLSHSQETKDRLNAVRKEHLLKGSRSKKNKTMTGEKKAKWIEKRKALYKLERWRIVNGIKRETKLFLSSLTKKQQAIKNFLCSRRKYFSDCRIDPYALFYDEQTVRFSSKYKYDETYYSCKYSLHFLPADGYEEDDVRFSSQTKKAN